MLIPKKAFEVCGKFDERLRYNQDALMWYKIFGNGYTLISDNHNNVMYRLHSQQTSNMRPDLLKKDSVLVSKEILPFFAANNSKGYKLILKYSLRNAKYCCGEAVNECIDYGKKNGIFTAKNILLIRFTQIYGQFRAMLKKMYYKIFLRIKKK